MLPATRFGVGNLREGQRQASEWDASHDVIDERLNCQDGSTCIVQERDAQLRSLPTIRRIEQAC